MEVVQVGTGAFIDEIASLLSVPTEKFEDLAKNGKSVFDISGRCRSLCEN